MSESEEPTRAGPAAGRYARTTGGLVGAMIVTVVAVLALVAFRALTEDHQPTPIRTVDYVAVAKAARSDGQLQVLIPDRLPRGWKATSASYQRGASAAWHLGMLTDALKYVGVEESRSSIQDLATEHVDTDARRGKDVIIGGETWQTFTDTGGDYAVARSQAGSSQAGSSQAGSSQAGSKPVESWIVVGSAPAAEIRDLAATLRGANTP